MSWTKLSDDFADRADLASLDFADRWHYLAMIQLCSRGNHLTGILRAVDARRASDHPDPGAAVQRLADVGLLTIAGDSVKVVEIHEHIPPPSVRNSTEASTLRKRRQRAHEVGDHSSCIVGHCDEAPATPAHPPVTPNVTRDSGTGRDGPGRASTEAKHLQSARTREDEAPPPERPADEYSLEKHVDPGTGEVAAGWPTAKPGRGRRLDDEAVSFPLTPYGSTRELTR